MRHTPQLVFIERFLLVFVGLVVGQAFTQPVIGRQARALDVLLTELGETQQKVWRSEAETKQARKSAGLAEARAESLSTLCAKELARTVRATR